MTTLKPRGDLEILLLRKLPGRKQPMKTARIRRKRLLEKHVDTLLDSILDMHLPNICSRRAHRNVTWLEDIDSPAVSIEADERRVLANARPFAAPRLEGRL